jgi:hypothetical protein
MKSLNGSVVVDREAQKKSSVQDTIAQVANQDTTYAIPVDLLSRTMLDSHVRFVNRAAAQEGTEPPVVITYECKNFDYESFGTVAKILQRSYIDRTASSVMRPVSTISVPSAPKIF